MWEKENVYREEFELCGSMEGRKFYLNFELQSVANYSRPLYCFKITIEDVLSTDGNDKEKEEEESKSQYQQVEQQSKRQKLNKSTVSSNMRNQLAGIPTKIWLDSHVSSTIELPLLEEAKGIWEVGVTNPDTQTYIAVWMDFGTSEKKEKRIVKRQLDMFHNQHQCDVQFDFDDGQSVGAHIVILSASSPVFAAMFQSNLLETKTRKVTIVDVKIDVFKQFLIFLYAENTPRLAEEGITRLLFELADKYNVGALKDECVDVILTQVNIRNVIDMLVWAHFHSIEKLLEKAMNFLVKNFRKLCFQPEWAELIKTNPDLSLLASRKLAELQIESESEDSE
jgi:hypothetical protein